MKKKALLFLCFIFVVSQSMVNCFGIEPENSKYILKNAIWQVSVNPNTLEIAATIGNQAPFSISSPQIGLGDIQNVKSQSNTIDWELREQKLKFDIRLENRDLKVNIQSSVSGDVVFPVIQPDSRLQAYIVPHWEGMYIPIQDKKWQEYLINRSFDTLEGLTMPFFGLDLGSHTLTTIITNRFNNTWRFRKSGDSVQSSFIHTFKNNNQTKEITFIFHLGEEYSPVEPAKVFRNFLEDNDRHVKFTEKLKATPKVERLQGAIHAYLWGNLKMSLDDVLPDQWQSFCKELVNQAESKNPSPGLRLKELSAKKDWEELVKCANLSYRPYVYLRSRVAEVISEVLLNPKFYTSDYFNSLKLPEKLVQSLDDPRSESELFYLNSQVFFHSFPKKIRHPDLWGYGYSLRMLDQIHSAGIKRARLVHGLWDFGMIDAKPQVAAEADKLGYLIAPYDSFHSIHNPKHYGTDLSWSTAQFDPQLYEKGGVQLENGKYKRGFMGRGYMLSPIAARPWVEKRVNRIINNTPYNSYFIDCDAFGEVIDDYSPHHLSTQEDDLNERVDRMKWIRDHHKLVIGSEGGSSYAAPVIHVAEGMMSSPFGKWVDPDFGDKNSRYYLGGWFPQHQPEIFFKRVPLKENLIRTRYDPRFRLPLNEIVFHDSFISTQHWQSSTRKFSNIQDVVELTSLLYLTPPMYHFNPPQFKQIKKEVKRHYDFFHPLHKKRGLSQMTEFKWISDDHLVQKTRFGDDLEMVANYKNKAFTYLGVSIPAKSILSFWLNSKTKTIYTPNSL